MVRKLVRPDILERARLPGARPYPFVPVMREAGDPGVRTDVTHVVPGEMDLPKAQATTGMGVGHHPLDVEMSLVQQGQAMLGMFIGGDGPGQKLFESTDPVFQVFLGPRGLFRSGGLVKPGETGYCLPWIGGLTGLLPFAADGSIKGALQVMVPAPITRNGGVTLDLTISSCRS